MKNTNSPIAKLKKFLNARWEREDYPGSKPRFQLGLFAKDAAIHVLPVIVIVFLLESCQSAFSGPKKNTSQRSENAPSDFQETHSQIIDFRVATRNSPLSGIAKRSPGTLVKVRLLNVVETYSSAPVHAQIVDAGLGRNLVGSTIIGDATSDSNFDRIEINFRFVRDQRSPGVAIPITARALSMDGTLGVAARKKEGFFARAALGSSGSAAQDTQGKIEGSDLKTMIAKALTAGLLQEYGNESQIAKNRAQVLSLQPASEFYVELTDYFPGTK